MLALTPVRMTLCKMLNVSSRNGVDLYYGFSNNAKSPSMTFFSTATLGTYAPGEYLSSSTTKYLDLSRSTWVNPGGVRPKLIGWSAGRHIENRKSNTPFEVIIPTSPTSTPRSRYSCG